MFKEKRKKLQPEERRFRVKEEQSLGAGALQIGMGSLQIVVDTVTGINYLLSVGTSMSGITPLLDENGKVVIDKNS